MKTIHALKAAAVISAMALFVACGTQYRGSAADRTGTNGATNGNGKIPTSPAN